ncbi:hypothetical protein [Sphingomonas sp.]|uniref:hypothetical protein n=1 Tax=Sphingomonas sp. TaxID=28214 RepID=UPI003B00A7ED
MLGIGKGVRWGAGLAAALALASAASATGLHRKRVVRPPFAAPLAGGIGSFTPAAADPRLASSLLRGGLGGGSGFRFTPAVAPGASRRVTVAVRARAATPAEAERIASAGGSGAIGQSAYNLGVAVGWKRFAITSDYAKVDLGPVPGSRESADVAVSFAGHRWSTRLALAADHALGEVPRLIERDRNVSVDLGGSYSISNRLDVTGGLRYKRDFDGVQMLTDDRRDSQAVYVGTAFRF